MKKKILRYLPRIVFLTFFITCSVIFFFSSPDRLISFIGVENVYFIIFILSFLGGLSTFSGVPYHLVLVTFAMGGASQLLLGLSAAIGVVLGDSTSYLVGYEGREVIPGRIQGFLGKIYAFGAKYPRAMPLMVFLYGSLSPFSNDFIVISAGLAKYSFWKVMLPLALGNVVFNVSLAYLARFIYPYFSFFS
jgi:membrane protein YqaA with SNARE-associated domain